MSFSEKQRRALKTKLSYRHVKTRVSNGSNIAYVEGWHVIAEANRIFGYDNWERRTLSPQCVWREVQRGQTACLYSTKVRIIVRAGPLSIVRDGIGTGFGRGASPEVAHEMALKAAETDATKRALATFGNPFGLALYDKDQTHVTKPPAQRRLSSAADNRARLTATEPGNTSGLVLRSEDGSERAFDTPDAFMSASLTAIDALSSIDLVYAFWERNLASFEVLRGDDATSPLVERIVGALKARLRAKRRSDGADSPGSEGANSLAPREPPALALPKERRLRDKDHLAFVATQPCLICGRRPAQAHHLRFAQPRAMSMKVSDEFTLPLCTIHHDQVHANGDERAWWARNGIIDPLKFAARLWAASRQGQKVIDETPVLPNGSHSASEAQQETP